MGVASPIQVLRSRKNPTSRRTLCAAVQSIMQTQRELDMGIQAVFPPDSVSSPNGKQLHKLFNHRTNASVTVIGTFESGGRSLRARCSSVPLHHH
jgi:hypothetical protein